MGDAIIVGASSAAQLEQNLGMEKDRLPDEVVQTLDCVAACTSVKRISGQDIKLKITFSGQATQRGPVTVMVMQ
ncbi:hypothetical protein V1527DRAFT_477651 [Lipomyces starkeyi]